MKPNYIKIKSSIKCSKIRFLQTSSLKFPWKIKRVYKGGSLAKGTGIRDNVDLDLCVFIEKTEEMLIPEEFLEKRKEIVQDVADKFARRFHWRRTKGGFDLYTDFCRGQRVSVGRTVVFFAHQRM